MTSYYSEEQMQQIMDEARAMRSKEVARLFGLLLRRRTAQSPSNAVNG